MKTKRISTTIPGDLKDDLQLRARQAGISVSRLVYLILIRKNKPLLIVPNDIKREIVRLNRLFLQIKKAGTIPDEALTIMKERVDFINRMVKEDKNDIKKNHANNLSRDVPKASKRSKSTGGST